MLTTRFMLQNSLSENSCLPTDPYVETRLFLSELKLGHSYLTHSYMLKAKLLPECVTCHFRSTINHILIDCFKYDIFKLILFDNNVTLKDILNNVSPNDIISFIKRAGLYNTHLSFVVLFKLKIYMLF